MGVLERERERERERECTEIRPPKQETKATIGEGCLRGLPCCHFLFGLAVTLRPGWVVSGGLGRSLGELCCLYALFAFVFHLWGLGIWDGVWESVAGSGGIVVIVSAAFSV